MRSDIFTIAIAQRLAGPSARRPSVTVGAVLKVPPSRRRLNVRRRTDSRRCGGAAKAAGRPAQILVHGSLGSPSVTLSASSRGWGGARDFCVRWRRTDLPRSPILARDLGVRSERMLGLFFAGIRKRQQ